MFHAGDTRGREELEKRLGSSYEGVLISDDFSAYHGYPVGGQQKCLAHLRRHFQRLFKTKGLYNEQIAETFISLIDEAFKQHRFWRQYQDGISYRHWAQDFSVRVKIEMENWE